MKRKWIDYYILMCVRDLRELRLKINVDEKRRIVRDVCVEHRDRYDKFYMDQWWELNREKRGNYGKEKNHSDIC